MSFQLFALPLIPNRSLNPQARPSQASADNGRHFICDIEFQQQPQTLEHVPRAQLKAISWISKCATPTSPPHSHCVWPKDIHELSYADNKKKNKRQMGNISICSNSHRIFLHRGGQPPPLCSSSFLLLLPPPFSSFLLFPPLSSFFPFSPCRVIKVSHKCR